MNAIQLCELPPLALLGEYRAGGGWTDCYVTEVARPVSHAEFVEAFYTTTLFKLERLLLSWFAARPSTDAQARLLAAGGSDSFAAWSVERRTDDQILLTDFLGRTRSWLMVADGRSGSSSTLLYFGSAVVPRLGAPPGAAGMGYGFRALLGFHRAYSRALLGAARARLDRPWP